MEEPKSRLKKSSKTQETEQNTFLRGLTKNPGLTEGTRRTTRWGKE